MLVKIILSKADRAEVDEYLKKTGISLQTQVQAKVKTFIDNARWWNAERRRIRKEEKSGP